jgi:SAM-dependent methyltransferase
MEFLNICFEENYKAYIQKFHLILDAGCGLGREVINLCRANPKAEVFGLEIADCVDEAYENTKEFPNAHIIQADLMTPPFKRYFDFIFSEGVLHHTLDTFKALSSLVKLLKKGGEIAFYVYRKKAPIREMVDDYLREKISSLSFSEAYKICEGITELGRELSKINTQIELKIGIPYLDIPPGKYNLQRLFYYKIMKAFWNDALSFDENNLVNVDWYHPQYGHRHTPEEVKNWCKKLNLEVIWFNVEESGVTIRAKR